VPAPTAGTPPAVQQTAADIREAALRAARVWQPPAVPVSRADLAANPPGPDGFRSDADVTCRFSPTPVGGTTRKFNCEIATDDVVKVKYGRVNPELFTEAAATRLLSALGFPTDAVHVVGSVRCAGCPKFPFQALTCFAAIGLETPCFGGGIDYRGVETFQPATIERRLPGDKIEAFAGQGWSWDELERIDAAAGGSPPAELDALRLMAVVLAHWDNKAENQRLVCPPGERLPDGRCSRPLAIVQDLGATFGPSKLELQNWRQTAVWADPVTCAVSMRHLPFRGATFPDRRISEAGRQMLLGLLEQLSEAQLVDLFRTSGMTSYDHVVAASRDPKAWAAAFFDKVRQIGDAGPCP
jgi:hypothetical protein